MHLSERVFRREAQKRGYATYRNGWPDFLLVDRTGKDVRAVEVKGHAQILKPHQRRIASILEQLGIPVFISREGRWPELDSRVRWGSGAQHPVFLRLKCRYPTCGEVRAQDRVPA